MISKLHIITNSVEVAEQACAAGADWIQLRMKATSDGAFTMVAAQIREITKVHGAKLIINDRVEIAQKVGADGVHLGKDDMHPVDARKLLGEEAIIGGTVNNQHDLDRVKEGVDYVGVGPYRYTSTKENLSPVLGLDGIRQIAAQVNVPVVAIGGILAIDVPEILDEGIHGIAVSGAISTTGQVHENTRAFIGATTILT